MTASVREGPAHAEVVFAAKGCVFASYLNVGIAIFAARPALDDVAHLRKITSELVRAYGCTSTFYLATNNAPLPDAPVRDFLQALTNEVAKDLIAVASVIHGDGFWAGAVRGFATSVHWMSGHEYKRRVFSKCDEAVRWLAPLHSEVSLAIGAAELEREIVNLLANPSVPPGTR